MKYRAVIRDAAFMKNFLNIVTTLAKCGKDIVFNIKYDRLVLGVNMEVHHVAPPIWCEIANEACFDEYYMDGLSETYNEIVLLMKASNLVTALGNSRNMDASFVKLKLMNKNIACLCVEIESPSSVSTKSRPIICDVPVTVVSRRDWREYQLPELPPFEMTVGMPNVKSIRSMIDHMKNSSTLMTVQTAKEGTVSFIVESTMVKCSCICEDQNVFSVGIEDKHSCQIDTKKLALFFVSSQFPNSPMRCSISEAHLVRFEVEIQDKIVMTCVIPASSD
ncbi:Checkpoint protein [Sergentomyia squamirostris]